MSSKRKRDRRHHPTYLGQRRVPAPDALHWTPIRHTCGCVVDWGWDRQSDPREFLMWCLSMVNYNCAWHGAETGHPIVSPAGEMIDMHDPRTGRSFYARHARADDTELGGQLAEQLRDLGDKLDRNDQLAILAEMPAKYRNWLRAHGYDPVEAWVEQRLTDLVLNRGRVTVTDELLDQLPDDPSNLRT